MDRIHSFFICYDIRQPKRLGQVHRLVKRYAHQVQESVYYCQVKTSVMTDFKTQLERVIDLDVDDVRIYRLIHNRPIFWMGKSIHQNGIMDFSLPAVSEM